MLQSPYELLKEEKISNPVAAKEAVGIQQDPLSIDIEDKELADVLDKRIETSKNFFNGDMYRLNIRRERNEMFVLGRQITDMEKKNQIRGYEARYKDNALYEIEASIKPITLARLPDMMVMPGEETPESQDTARNISEVVNEFLGKKETRRVLAMATKHLPVYYTGIIKCVWNPELGEDGDIEFVNVHPNKVVIDNTATINDADKMKFIAEAVNFTVQDIFMRFPDKKEEFIEEMRKQGIKLKDPHSYTGLATEVQIWEVWFTWYKKKTDTEWERIEGVLWKYGKTILKKMKNPNYDHEGEQKYFTYQGVPGAVNRRESTPEEMMMAAMVGGMPNIQQELIYRNYFEMPRKPYFFMGYDQWGKIAYDETSRVEQNIENQQNLDQIGKRIIEKLKDRGKHVFSKDAGLQGKDIERMDLNNPDQDLLVDGDVNKTHGYIQPIEPTAQEFAELKLARERMFSLAGATNLNGILQSDVATSNQIAREQNFSRVDDLTEETINTAAQWMGEWIMQMIKLRYTEDKMVKILGGQKGSVTFLKIKNDMIQNGMEVRIKASGTDKQRRQNNAMQMAELKLIDPLSFYRDMDITDPEGRTEMLMMMQTDPMGYLMKFVMNLSPEEAAAKLATQPVPGALPPGASPGGAPPVGGPPQNPTPQSPAQTPIQPPQSVQASPSNGIL